MVQRIALGLEYDGRGFQGWQTQPGGGALQDHLEAALAIIHGAPLATRVAGRTDAGVHALQQIVHFDALHGRPVQAWVKGVNSHLPDGMAVLWARPVPEAFDARRSALERTYHYLLLRRPVRSPLLAGRVGWVHGHLDAAAMERAARHLLGTHDFSAFRAAECQARSPIRTLHEAGLAARDDLLCFTFRGNAFLHHQVRNMVGALVWVGLGRRSPDWLAEVLAGRDRSRAAATFAPDGLYLAGVRYDPAFALPAPLSNPLFPPLIP